MCILRQTARSHARRALSALRSFGRRRPPYRSGALRRRFFSGARVPGIVLAQPHRLIRPDVNPEQRKQAGYLLAGLGIVLGGVFYALGRRTLA